MLLSPPPERRMYSPLSGAHSRTVGLCRAERDDSVCPDAYCSWASTAASAPTPAAAGCRAPTAPSESRPASISGVRNHADGRLERLHDHLELHDAALRRPASRRRRRLAAGVPFQQRRHRQRQTEDLPHERTTKLITAGTPVSSAARNAVAPCSSPIRPMPDAWIRALTELLAAMPTSAHGPHCTLDAAWPPCRRHTPSESGQPFATP